MDTARVWAEALAQRLELVAVVVFGSSARGDFNKWSDLDVLVVARGLPGGSRERLDVLMRGAPPGLQAVGWTPAELAARRQRRDPIAVECDSVGVAVYGRSPACSRARARERPQRQRTASMRRAPAWRRTSMRYQGSKPSASAAWRVSSTSP